MLNYNDNSRIIIQGTVQTMRESNRFKQPEELFTRQPVKSGKTNGKKGS